MFYKYNVKPTEGFVRGVRSAIGLAAGALIVLFVVAACSASASAPADGDNTTDDRVMVESPWLVNDSYFAQGGTQGPPFPLMRLRTVVDESAATILFVQEFGDAMRTPHASFALSFTNFAETSSGATANFAQQHFQALSDDAVTNALSKWVTCRTMVRSKMQFAITAACLEVHEDDITVLLAADPSVDADLFPCGTTVGPDEVSNAVGDVVPDLDSVLDAAAVQILIPGLTSGEAFTLMSGGSALNNILVPPSFSQGTPTVFTGENLPACGSISG